MEKQHRDLLETTAVNTAMLKKMFEHENVQNEIFSRFPINSTEELQEFDKEVEDNEDDIVSIDNLNSKLKNYNLFLSDFYNQTYTSAGRIEEKPFKAIWKRNHPRI